MNKKLPLISLFIMSIVSIFYWTFKSKELYEAKWNAPDTTLAITINGEISTTFPTTNAYTGTVECTTGTGMVEWNGTKWVLTTSGITKGSTKCNADFINRTLTLSETILANNEIQTPLTTPGKEVSAHVLADVEIQNESVDSSYLSYYITYGTGWKANGTKFNLTGTAVTSDTYANSYSELVGKYISTAFIKNAGSSTAGTMVTTTNLDNVYYVVSATSDSFTYKTLGSNKNTTEALLASTEDDYGTSYYFRGAVKNNYVEFANKCWRIVRITGDGSVKIILHNDNTSNSANPCSSANNNDTAAFARHSGTSYTTVFNSNMDDNAYIGFMYGSTSANTYASTHANTNKSTILTNLEIWYINNLTSYENKISDTIWCNDKSTVSGGLGYGINDTEYASANRLDTTKTPTLKCPSDNNGGKLSKFTVSDTTNGNGNLTYKVGLLTADEAIFAGYLAFPSENYATYLQENEQGRAWWSLSPRYFNGYEDSGDAYAWQVGWGTLGEMYVNDRCGLRPVIALNSSLTISGGSGTSEDPYVVN